MLVELAVRNLGVIPEARIPVGPGLVALPGETGAGKTMVVEALHLLLGGRPDPTRVRVGTEEATVEGPASSPSKGVTCTCATSCFLSGRGKRAEVAPGTGAPLSVHS